MKGNGFSTLLRGLPALYEARTLESLPLHLARFLSGLISVDAVAYNEVSLKDGSMKVVSDTPGLNESPHVQDLASIIQDHPLVQHQQKTGDLSARKISDLLSRAAYHETAVYREVYRHIGCEDQMAFSLHATPGTIIAMAMNRSRRTFTEEQRQMLNLIQPHMAQVYRNAELLTALQEKLASVTRILDQLPMGVLVLSGRRQIKFATDHARTLLGKYFQHPISSSHLPPALSGWLNHSRQWHGQALPNPTGPFCLDGPGGKLLVRCVREAGSEETMLLLEERQTRLSSQNLRALGLTAREAEVLLWVAQGKRNPEIAIILGTAPRTVQKHLERIFSKLGVESRTAAASRALEVLNG